ncbi:MAG: DUF4842 domain-containing protein [Prevotella sp.]|nr:DUF4842 domain-containing protein [Prevotella sp.]
MKKLLSLLAVTCLTLTSCIDHETNLYKGDDSKAIKQNAEDVLGQIVRQDWSSINQGSVRIIANAPLNNIVKVQILTESPFGNPNAKVLNEAEIVNGRYVTLKYDAPNIYDRLIAACINDKGIYYVQSFAIEDNEVDFGEVDEARRGRAAENTYPAASSIVLGDPTKSFNALRAEATLASETHQIAINDGGTKLYYKDLYDESWLNDRLWAPKSKTDGDWHISENGIYKDISEDVDMSTVQAICDAYLQMMGGKHPTFGKSNNWELIAEDNPHFRVNNNYLISDGTPLIVTPVQMGTSEGNSNNIYYYYFDPAKTANMTSEEEANYIKSLPKFKAMKGQSNKTNFFRDKAYLLPYYGDGPLENGTTASAELAIPEGYKIGFLNRKNLSYNNTESCKNGCTYGDGRLNFEVNHAQGHFLSAMDTKLFATVRKNDPNGKDELYYGRTVNGMQFDSPRIAIFSANSRTYLCFEDGSDCNFCDMILEVSKGIKPLEEPQAPEASIYTMCFEDRLASADYDMNDIVLQASRVNETTIRLSLVASGANDMLQLQIPGYDDAKLTSKEVHELFNVAPGSTFINTKLSQDTFEPITEDFTVASDMSIEDFLKTITLNNLSTGKTISVPTTPGEPPYAIIVPMDFEYPLETICIKDAYSMFTEWVQTDDQTIFWYLDNDSEKVYRNKE